LTAASPVEGRKVPASTSFHAVPRLENPKISSISTSSVGVKQS